MKRIAGLIVAAILLVSLGACNKKEIDTKLKGYFYTPDSLSTELPLRLYMDGADKGSLPYIKASATEPLSMSDPALDGALQFELMSGTHMFEARKADGTVVASAEMSFRFYKNKTEGKVTAGTGGAGSALADHTVIVWMNR